MLAKDKRRHFLYRLFCQKEIFFKICVLSQCIVYWTHFQNTHTFAYQKALLQTSFCLFLKSSKAFSVSLILDIWLFDFVAVDPDNNYIKYRMADGPVECGSICNGIGNASLDGVSISYRRCTVSAKISSH